MPAPTLPELAVSAVPGGIVVVDDTGAILLANPALHRMFGYEDGRLIGRNLDDLVPGVVRGAGGDLRPMSGQPPTTPTLEWRRVEGRRQDGSPVRVQVGLSPTSYEATTVVIVSVLDSAPREDAEAQLLSRQAFERVLAEVSAGFLTSPDDQVDAHITESQRRLAQLLDAERGSLWQANEAGDLRCTHMWTSDPALITPPPDQLSAATEFPWVMARIRAGVPVAFERVDDIPDARDRETYRLIGTRSGVVLPLASDGRLMGALTFATMSRTRTWDAYTLERLQLIAAVFASALSRRAARLALEASHREVLRLRDQLVHESVQLRREVHALKGPRVLATRSAASQAVLTQIEQVAPTPATVLLLGETGAGKEVFAEVLHELSPRRQKRMVRVNCGAIPSALIESELFGRERGAYTGAITRQAGRFELADHSTILLDEVGDLPLDAQAKVLRVLQDQVIERLGSPHPIKVDVRVIAATNRNLEQAVADRTFREDLYYRLNVFPIRVPALRERVEDIPTLVWAFISEFSTAFGKDIESLSKGSLEALQAYPWPGNVRELRNVVERAVIVATGRQLVIDPPRPSLPMRRRVSLKLVDVEIDHLRTVLDSCGWRIRGTGGAADLLGMKPTTLESRMAKLGIGRIDRPAGTSPRPAKAPVPQQYEG